MIAPRRRLLALVAVVATLPVMSLSGGAAVAASSRHWVEVPQAARSAVPSTGLAPALRALGRTPGLVDVSVRLSQAPISEVVADGAAATGELPSAAAQKGRLKAVRAQQDAVAEQAKALGATVTGRATRAANVLTLRVDVSKLSAVAALPGVLSVKPIARYETHEGAPGSGSLGQAVDYLGAKALHDSGIDGSGVRIAVLDSGIDYTHANLGGPGTVAAYEACYGDADNPVYDRSPRGACAKLFGSRAPKVKGGYDFVGETWPGTPEAPDPNPIDLEGHGTHVADIAAGRSADGSHEGLAPGADLYALKVCSAVATSCSGIAILQAIDWALDPDGDADLADAVDIMNLSLGSPYGQPQDDATVALNNAVRAGVLAVVSAGNSADRPFIVGSPSTAARVVSVAQTALPDDVIYPITVVSPVVPGLPANQVRFTVAQPWAPAPTGVLTGDLAQPADPLGCTPLDFESFPAGAIALIARGACNASAKAANASAAGASAVVIWNNVDGEPPTFSFGGGEVTVPTFTVSLARGGLLADALDAGPVTISLDPADTVSLRNTTVGTSSRGPRMGDELTKPDLGAPGAWLSAEVGTGAQETNFGGTSGAAPTVSGVAALIIQAYPSATPATVKSRLLNGADTGNTTLDPDANPYPTPVSRVGSGEVRASSAVRPYGVLTNEQVGAGNVGLGLPHLSTRATYPIQVTLRNNSSASRTYELATTFRDPADAATGAVSVTGPSSATVPARSTKTVTFRVTINPAKLPRWPFTLVGGQSGDGSALNGPEFDGSITATYRGETLHLGWQVLPKRSADVSADAKVTLGADGTGSLGLTNASTVQAGDVDVYGLTGTSPRQPRPAPGDPGSAGSNRALIDLRAVGVADYVTDGVIGFALAGYQRQTLPGYPAGYEVDLDTDRDGEADFALYQAELGGLGVTGQVVVNVLDLATGNATAYYYAAADFDASTVVFYAPLEALGLAAGDTFDFSVLAYDNYFSGVTTDSVEGMSWTVGSSKYSLPGAALTVPAGASGQVAVSAVPGAGESSETGLLLFAANAKSQDALVVKVAGNG